MKFQVTFKDPDALSEELAAAATKQLEAIEGLDDEQRLLLHEKQCEKLAKIAHRWIGDGEYITVEFDTDAKTCVVVKP